MYSLLTGKLPYDGATDIDVQAQILDPDKEPIRPRVHIPSIPPVLEAICLRCLAKDPTGRYDSAGKLAKDLRAFLHDEPTDVIPDGVLSRVTGMFAASPRLAEFQSWRALIRAASILGVLVNSLLFVIQRISAPDWAFAVHGSLVLLMFGAIFFLAWKATRPGDLGRELLLIMTSATVSWVLIMLICRFFMMGGNWRDDNLSWPFMCVCNAQASVVIAYRLKKYFYMVPLLFGILAFITAWDRERAPVWFAIGWFCIIYPAGFRVPRNDPVLAKPMASDQQNV